MEVDANCVVRARTGGPGGGGEGENAIVIDQQQRYYSNVVANIVNIERRGGPTFNEAKSDLVKLNEITRERPAA